MCVCACVYSCYFILQSPEGEDDPLVVFRDIRPAAKHHYLVCTKQHIKDASVLGNNHISLGK